MTVPLQLGPASEFAAVRAFLQAAGFTLPAVAARLHQTLPYDFTVLRPGPADTDPQDALEMLIRVFVLGEAAAPAQIAGWVPGEAFAAMQTLGLLAPYAEAPGRLYSPVTLCPVDGVYVASERWTQPDGSPFSWPPDAVYPALTRNTQVFLGNLSRQPCDRLLDLCSGSGVAALVAAAGFATHAVAADIAPRSTAFTEFNRRLNALENVTVVEGDLYEPVKGQTFDYILAHPPYVPVLRPGYLYRDGGTDGEEITRRIIEGLPVFLRPGGVFQCHTSVSDRELMLEQRIREWLGEKQAEFDVVLIIWIELDPERFVLASAAKERGLEDLKSWKKLFQEWKVRNLLDVSISLIRHGEAREPLDLRRQGGDNSGPPEVDWLLRWLRIAALPETHAALLRSRPKAAAGLRFTVTHVVEEDELRAANCRAGVPYPFAVEVEMDRWMPLLLAACNGRRTGLELMAGMCQQGHIPADTPPEKFAALLAAMISRGFIVVPEFAPPQTLKAMTENQPLPVAK